MKKVMMFIGLLSCFIQGPCFAKDNFLVANDSNESISVAPVLKIDDMYLTLGSPAKIAPGHKEVFKQFEGLNLNIGVLNSAGLMISVGDTGQEKFYPGKFKGPVRFTDPNLKQFFESTSIVTGL